jgi:hypothetical protein
LGFWDELVELLLWAKGCAETRHETFEIWDLTVEMFGLSIVTHLVISVDSTQTRLPGRKPKLLMVPRPPVSPHAAVVLFLLIALVFVCFTRLELVWCCIASFPVT